MVYSGNATISSMYFMIRGTISTEIYLSNVETSGKLKAKIKLVSFSPNKKIKYYFKNL